MNTNKSSLAFIARTSNWIAAIATLVTTNTFAAGVAVFKEQNYHGDATATPIAYERIIDNSGPFIKLVTSTGVLTFNTKTYVTRVEVLSAMPEEIGTDEQMLPIRKSLDDLTAFAKKYPKSAPLLKQQITALKVHVATFDSGKRRYNGEWISRIDYARIEFHNKKGLEEIRQRHLEKTEQKRIQRLKEDAYAAQQRAKGLEMYGDKWLPVAEAVALHKADAERNTLVGTVAVPNESKEQNEVSAQPNKNVAKHSQVKVYARTVAMSRKNLTSTNYWVGGTPLKEEILYEHTKQIFRHRVIAVGVTNTGETTDFILEVFWLGHPLNKSNRTCVNALAAKKISVPPGEVMTFEVASNYNFVDSTLVYLKRQSGGSDYWNGLYVRTWSGYGYAGWIARVSDGHGKTLGVVGARPPMIAFANDFQPPTFSK